MLKKLRWLILKIGYPIIQLAGKLGKPEPEVSANFYDNISRTCLVGDVLLSRENWKMTNILIPGYWSHAAIYAGEVDGIQQVVEAVGSGVKITPLVKWVLSKDQVAHLKPNFLDDSLKSLKSLQDIGEVAESIVGSKYDFDFKSGNKTFYCAEVIWYCYDQVLDPSPFTFRETLGVETVAPDDFYNAKSKFKVMNLFKDGKILG